MRKVIFVLVLILAGILSCGEKEKNVLSPEEAIADFEIEEGFRITCVAHEPDVQDPVAIAFDDDANMWVVEMNTYMPDANGIDEQSPKSRIKILSDKDGDGSYETVRIFADSLILPRAVCPVYGGVLIAEPPFLWFYNEAGTQRIAVDSFYADGGNVEHQPNGLLLGIDNWIYSAKSDKRYRLYQGKWEKENTVFRGQWGIDQDDEGRLYYNHNTAVLLGDQWAPSILPYLSTQFGDKVKNLFGQSLISNHVYPRLPTPGVNRGYEQGVLDSEGRLVSVTSACGISVYGGDQFGHKYKGNAFSCEPAAQLIKRIILEDHQGKVSGRLPYSENEFLRSGDEKFRPVYTITGPDGALYVVDMYRGIIQHNTYMTSYLRKHIESKGLDKIKGMGRIYRIQKKANPAKQVILSDKTGKALTDLLAHPNKWVRIRAQWKIVHSGDEEKFLPLFIQMFKESKNDITKLHILHILNQYKIHDDEIIKKALFSGHPVLRHQAMMMFSSMNYKTFMLLRDMANQRDEMVFVASTFRNFKQNNDVTKSLIRQYANDSLYGALIAGSLWQYSNINKITNIRLSLAKNTLLYNWLEQSPFQQQNDEALNHLSTSEKEMFKGGKHTYGVYCATCHGINGEGVDRIAPPLAKSEWVTASDHQIPVSIVLNGISGPIIVGGKEYNFPAPMPGLKDNQAINNGTIAEIITYIRNSWGNKSGAVSTEDVSKVRMAPPMDVHAK
jgi:mono/diheme cytochrome c family protein